MIAALKAFLSDNALRVAGWFMAALSALGILFAARRAGRNAERAEVLKKQSQQVSKAHEIQDTNRRTLADGDAAERLQRDWSRD